MKCQGESWSLVTVTLSCRSFLLKKKKSCKNKTNVHEMSCTKFQLHLCRITLRSWWTDFYNSDMNLRSTGPQIDWCVDCRGIKTVIFSQTFHQAGYLVSGACMCPGRVLIELSQVRILFCGNHNWKMCLVWCSQLGNGFFFFPTNDGVVGNSVSILNRVNFSSNTLSQCAAGQPVPSLMHFWGTC